MIAIAEHPAGCIVPVRAQARAKRTGIQGEQGGALKVAVLDPPLEGKANDAIIELLRQAFGVRRSQIELISGAKSRDKRFLIRDLTAGELLPIIEGLIT